ncbi:pathogenesis-related protein 5-like [Anoplophora glabripennis]|uniref:pathogenesis-related protein 5-like n=1 Tax=Anoplophora glabripennis TaxID=217634 RepID=UPI000874F312|nr:pathogenesis-related protein 5-like [Anoplophora glabripennis]
MFKLVVVATVLATVYAVEFEFKNLEIGDVWVGIQGNSGKDALEGGGFVLAPSASRVVTAPEDWAGRFWPRTWCDAGTNHCLTGDCGDRLQCGGNGGAPPASLAEITLKGADGLDFYDISLVDGFNIPISFEPVNGQGDGGQYSCKKATCAHYINDDCPDALKLNTDSAVVGCKSACLAFNTDQYCCRNAYGTPDTCKSSEWPVDYPAFFKNACPDAYSYAYDDHKSTFTCKAEKYIITFGM